MIEPSSTHEGPVRCSPSERARFREEVFRGLAKAQKKLSPKWLYDEVGSLLYERITELPEYYPTRTETHILETHASEIARIVGPRVLVVEPGAGSGKKTEILLEALEQPQGYVPVDIASEALVGASARLAARFPGLPLYPVVADFTHPLHLPAATGEATRRMAFFPGSTIGNLDPDDAVGFLAALATCVGGGGALLIGVDHLKDVDLLLRAYDDAERVTAAFDLNLLHRMNRDLEADFVPRQFRHESRFDPARSRVEMHLVSRAAQTAEVAGRAFTFGRGESIHTESAYKWAPATFDRLARRGGWQPVDAWFDEREWFSVRLYRHD